MVIMPLMEMQPRRGHYCVAGITSGKYNRSRLKKEPEGDVMTTVALVGVL